VGEGIIQVTGPDSIASALASAASYLNNQAYESATGERLQYEIEIRPVTRKQRTPTQNNCIHAYCELLAGDLNRAGHERVITSPVLNEPLHVLWSKDTVKSDIWIRVQEATTGKKHSSKLTTTEASTVYEIIARHMAQTFGITTPWPTWMNQGGKAA